MEPLLTTLVLWLSANFGLPTVQAHPKIEIAPPVEIATRHYGTFNPHPQSQSPRSQSAPHDGGQIAAIYDTARATIFLPTGWTGSTPAELSVLVHELVPHLQHAAKLTYECPAAREQLAYAAQEKWLSCSDAASRANLSSTNVAVGENAMLPLAPARGRHDQYRAAAPPGSQRSRAKED